MAALPLGGAAAATPFGAAASAAAAIAATPNTSASGDITSGLKLFNVGSGAGALNFGTQVPAWAWIAAATLVGLYLYKRK